MAAESSSLRQYLNLLGVGNRDEQVARVLYELTGALRKRNRLTPPIKLSTVATDFLISPKPVFDAQIKEGRLEYSNETGRFIIRLNAALNLASSSNTVRPSHGTGSGLRRMRFTYAHEIAHRFFYICRDGGWKRALEVVPSHSDGASNIQMLLNLRRLEERLCNEIASNILVPTDLLVSAFNKHILDSPEGLQAAFFDNIVALSDLFLVSRTCLLMRMLKTSQKGGMIFPSTFGFALVRQGTSGIKGNYHIIFFMIPACFGTEVHPVFPGMAVEYLGQQWADFSMRFAPDRQSRQVELETLLRKSDQTPINTRLRGWSCDCSFKGPDGARQFLIWGDFSDL